MDNNLKYKSVMSQKEAAAYLGVSELWICLNKNKYNIPYAKIGKKTVRFLKDDLDVYLKSLTKKNKKREA